jgi:hypothetical protein
VISEAIAKLRADAGIPVDPSRRGPVPLDKFFEAANLTHKAIPRLTPTAIRELLLRERYVSRPDSLAAIEESDDLLAGFLFWSSEDGVAFVDANDILPRRRFTAAHELGHAVLHRSQMSRTWKDKTIEESTVADDPMEREANRFAAELLMPSDVIAARANELRAAHGCCPRGVLVYRLASELLVSRVAMRYRIQTLKLSEVEDD